MTELDKIIDANELYSHNFKHGSLPIPPARKLAVLACMDARLNVNEALGLETGDAHIIETLEVLPLTIQYVLLLFPMSFWEHKSLWS